MKLRRLRNFSIAEMELKSGIDRGTILQALKNKQELSPQDIQKLATAFKRELNEEDFILVEGKAFNLPGLVIAYYTKEEDNPYTKGTEEWTNWLIDHHIKAGTFDKNNLHKVIVKGIHLKDSVYNMNYDGFLETVLSKDYLRADSEGNEETYAYLPSPVENYETIIWFDPNDGKVEEVIWSLGKLKEN